MTTKTKSNGNVVAIVAMFFLFAMIAFVTNLCSPMAVIVKTRFGASNFASQLGNAANFIAYAVMGIPSGMLLKKIGYKKTALLAIFVGFVGVFVQYMSGWESNNVYGYDTTDPALMPELYFDKETGEMCFISQYVNTLVNASDTYDFFFSGTFTYGNTYVLGSEVLNYRMADAGFLDSTYRSALIKAGTFETQGMSFPIESICYMYSVGGQLGAISLAPPTLPLNLTKVK
jgi:MFS family permease